MLDQKNLSYEALLKLAEKLDIDTNENTDTVELYFLILEAEEWVSNIKKDEVEISEWILTADQIVK